MTRHILRKRSEFLRVRQGITIRRHNLVLQARPRADRDKPDPCRFGVTATKKIGNAVTRNRAKRRLRCVAQHVLDLSGQPNWDYVFIARFSTVDASWANLCRDAGLAMKKLPDHSDS